MKVIDLRSDTVTLPTHAMYEAMVAAPLGDDVLGHDPTAQRLEALAARKLGKEAALFTASGTMSNLLAMLSHCQRGDEVIVGSEAHILHYETGGAFALGGLGLRTVANDPQGRLDPTELRLALRRGDLNSPATALICLENTHNRCGGTVLSEEDLAPVVQVAEEWRLPVHLDGARIFNASAALGAPVERLTAGAESVCFSLCKGLACPVGSVLCGSAEFIERARRFRKMLGGGMRQAGVLAAAGIVALGGMVERLAEDHRNAQLLAQGLASLPGVSLSPWPQSNLVFFIVQGWDLAIFVRECAAQDLLCLDEGGRIRMVTHNDIARADVEAAVERVGAVLKRAA